VKPFDVVTDISSGKKKLIDSSNEKLYNAFIINRALSYFPDTVFYAQEMNINHHLDNLLQHDFLFHSIRKAKRFSKWSKKDKVSYIEIVQEYFKYSNKRAEEALKILSKKDISEIKKRLERGGQ
jgi:hypothetical protein